MNTLRPIFALALKDLRLLSRDKANCFFTFVFPLLLAVFFGLIFGGGGGGGGTIDVAIVDLSTSEASKNLIADLSADKALAITAAPDEAAGERMVRTGDVQACIVIPASFESDLSNIFAGGGVALTAIIDPARSAEAGLLTGKLNEHGFRQLSRVFADADRMDSTLAKAKSTISADTELPLPQKLLFSTLFESVNALAKARQAPTLPVTTESPTAPTAAAAPADGGWAPITVTTRELLIDRKRPRSSFEISFPQGVVWGLMGCIMAFGASLAEERTKGTLTRLTTAPISRGQILAGKALACFISCLFVQVLLVLLAVLVFKSRFLNPGFTILAMLAASIGFTGIMMFMAGLSRTEGAAQGYGRAIVLVLAMIGGGTIPVFFMPSFMKTISGISPFKWAVEAIEGGMWRGFTFPQMLVPIGILLGIGIIGFVIGTMAMRWSEN